MEGGNPEPGTWNPETAEDEYEYEDEYENSKSQWHEGNTLQCAGNDAAPRRTPACHWLLPLIVLVLGCFLLGVLGEGAPPGFLN